MANSLRIGYAAKRRGDLWTATEANEVKEVANNHAGIIDGHTSSISTINNSLDLQSQQLQQNTQNIRLLQETTKSVWLTEEEYRALVEAETVDPATEYNIYEEQS
jgi:hypothetical protein